MATSFLYSRNLIGAVSPTRLGDRVAQECRDELRRLRGPRGRTPMAWTRVEAYGCPEDPEEVAVVYAEATIEEALILEDVVEAWDGLRPG